MAMNIVLTYLNNGSILELNIPTPLVNVDELIETIEVVDPLPHDLFDDIQRHCLNDMTDLFERLKRSDKEFKAKVNRLNEL